MGIDGLLHKACACAVGAFVALRGHKKMRHADVHRGPPHTPSDDVFYVTWTLVDYSRLAHAESITQASVVMKSPMRADVWLTVFYFDKVPTVLSS